MTEEEARVRVAGVGLAEWSGDGGVADTLCDGGVAATGDGWCWFMFFLRTSWQRGWTLAVQVRGGHEKM